MERADVVEALKAVDTETLKAVAVECGYAWRGLFDYRKGHREIPERRVRPLGRALGLK